MARHARDKTTFGTYYIHQHSSVQRKLFIDDADRLKFVEILKRTKKKFNYKLYAFCLNSPDAYHLIIYDNGGDISKIMKSINISYAMYAKCDGVLFKDRYKSSRIHDFDELGSVIDNLRATLVKKQWDGYCNYTQEEEDRYGILDKEVILDFASENDENFSYEVHVEQDKETSNGSKCANIKAACQHDRECMECVEEAKKKLTEICFELGLTLEELLEDKVRRNMVICNFRRNSTLSLKELGQLFGGLSESTICKILNKA